MNDRLRPTLLPLPDAASAFALYQEGAMLFSSPTATLLGHGSAAQLAPCPGHALAANARALLQTVREQVARPVLMGAVPFLPEMSARLVIPQQISLASGPVSGLHSKPASGLLRGMRMQPEPAAYKRNVEQALQMIAQGRFDKVVLARSLMLDVDMDLPALLHNLASRNPLGYTFAMNLPGAGRRTLIGASPELLLSRRGPRVISRPLAGSIARSADATQDQQRAASLLASSKDRREHALVVDAVITALRPFCRNISVTSNAALQSTATMWHLGSEITGDRLASDPCRLRPSDGQCA